MPRKIMALLILSTLLAQSSSAIYSPRAMGMGEAFTAIADDAYAAYYNPAGFAINPGIDVAANYQLTNRNQSIGDNAFALKGCFEIGMDPFSWIAGVGLASMFAYDGARYLADRGIVKKNWGRTEEKFDKEESMADTVKEEGDDSEITPISKKEIAKAAAKEIARGTIHVAKKYARAALKEASQQSRHYMYASPWHSPNYYRPTYWDSRYDYTEKELTPLGKAQFGGGITIMSDQNANAATDQDTNWYSFSVASGWGEIAAVGANLNLYDLKIPSTGTKGFGAGLDLGGLLRISDTLMFGLTAKELLTTDIQWANNTKTRYQMNVNIGGAIKPVRQVTVAADMHNIFGQNGQGPTMHYGLEVKPIYGLALRAGQSDSSKTAGFSLGIEQLLVDYAYLGGAYNRTQMIGVTWKI
ncbi:hypothetical protein A3H38_03080 [candidate division WOR-1 bacterium RIFCSPLOWO2_02_FULL_46_20]|uniref:DUF5723 domain-containing protein n=1 Tax=candidate division WOR-1 bacterium RIFCSPLOWO2_02_FULL_46_20 TaxID=1802567 RepID=A0A1F4RAR9_UNCSA|nr:MAG: hypothetical protein A3H38_03080 [candidate division WOR-1 bacterium RIFCSPLOWO2_02_FULL_46_20]